MLLLALLASACGQPPNSLSGSVGEVFALEVSSVTAIRNEEALQLTYLRNRERELDIVLRVVVALGPEESLVEGGRLPLEGSSPQGYRRVTLLHVPGGEPARELGEVEDGELRVSGGGELGERLEGDFSARFPEGEGLTAGRNVFGTFDVLLEDGRIDAP